MGNTCTDVILKTTFKKMLIYKICQFSNNYNLPPDLFPDAEYNIKSGSQKQSNVCSVYSSVCSIFFHIRQKEKILDTYDKCEP